MMTLWWTCGLQVTMAVARNEKNVDNAEGTDLRERILTKCSGRLPSRIDFFALVYG